MACVEPHPLEWLTATPTDSPLASPREVHPVCNLGKPPGMWTAQATASQHQQQPPLSVFKPSSTRLAGSFFSSGSTTASTQSKRWVDIEDDGDSDDEEYDVGDLEDVVFDTSDAHGGLAFPHEQVSHPADTYTPVACLAKPPGVWSLPLAPPQGQVLPPCKPAALCRLPSSNFTSASTTTSTQPERGVADASDNNHEVPNDNDNIKFADDCVRAALVSRPVASRSATAMKEQRLRRAPAKPPGIWTLPSTNAQHQTTPLYKASVHCQVPNTAVGSVSTPLSMQPGSAAPKEEDNHLSDDDTFEDAGIRARAAFGLRSVAAKREQTPKPVNDCKSAASLGKPPGIWTLPPTPQQRLTFEPFKSVGEWQLPDNNVVSPHTTDSLRSQWWFDGQDDFEAGYATRESFFMDRLSRDESLKSACGGGSEDYVVSSMGPVLGSRHAFHDEARCTGDVSADRRQVTKRTFQGRLSVLTNEIVHTGFGGPDELRYLVQFTAGKLSSADGVGFVFSNKLPCPRDIQKITSIFVNRAGRICMRMQSQVVRFKASVKQLELGDWIELSMDLQKQTATFVVWPADGSLPSSAVLRYADSLVSMAQELPAGTSLPSVLCGHVAIVVKNVGVTVSLGS